MGVWKHVSGVWKWQISADAERFSLFESADGRS